MKNKYGEIAIKASKNNENNPRKSWDIAAKEAYIDKLSACKKGCPKDAFLGLCAEGFVIGIPKGDYTKSIINKGYAIKAIEFLRKKPKERYTPSELWAAIKKNKNHNNQMDVVWGLWEKKLIEKQ